MKKAFWLTFVFVFFSCGTSRVIKPIPEIIPEPDRISITFGGDIMCHSENARGKFDSIYTEIKDIIASSDFSIVNFECPVDDEKPYSSYPAFNCHTEYLNEAINSGFNVFSLANNHTNDFYLSGIKSTKKIFEEIEEKTTNSSRPVYACGIKEESDFPLTYRILKKGNWTIVFAAVTQLLNRPKYSSYIDYYPMTKTGREKLKKDLNELKTNIPCDLFILSLHTSEEEYVLSIDEKYKSFFDSLTEDYVDILLVNHPHVVRPYKIISENPPKAVFYAQGNLISGQRRDPKFSAPETLRDYTGDGLLSTIIFEKSGENVTILSENHTLITTYINDENYYSIKKLNDDTINSLSGTKWHDYLKKRKEIMEKHLWQ